MLSLRAAARSAPRALGRFSATVIRQSSPISSTLRAATMPASRLVSQRAAFSTSRIFREATAENEVDEQLSAKLESEIQFETEVKAAESQPASVKDFLDSGLFEIEDTPGKESIVLKRTYGSENITVTFSIADLANYDPEGFDEDPALADEGMEEDGQSRARANEESEELDEMDGEEDEAAVPCRLSIVVEKPGKGALNIEATAQDGSITVENLYFYTDGSLANPVSAEAVHKAKDQYPGPPFGSLDEDLQILMERYLEERGITQALAVFVPDYMDMKEQKEYLSWLNNLKNFVDA